MRSLFTLSLAALLCCSTPCFAAERTLTEAQEQRYLELLKELRCLVCQNQSLAESGSGLAAGLRTQIRTMIASGEDNEAIKQYAVNRYSDFILYNPRFKPETYALWITPFLLLAIGLLFLWLQIRKQSTRQEE